MTTGAAVSGRCPAAIAPDGRLRDHVVPMLLSFLRTLVKVAVASLIVGTILAHFGLTFDMLMGAAGLSTERIEAILRRGLAFVGPNMALGALIIIPVWFLAYIFRPPGPTGE
jgi:hypothetical protein